MKEGIDERIVEGVLQRFSHLKRMEGDRITKRVYVGECAGSRSVSRPRKIWTDNVKRRFRKRCLNVRQRKRMLQDRSECRGFVRGNAWGGARGMYP